MSTAARIATSVLTGFLGSGKTTLLNRLLQDRRLKNAAVLVNEFGEIGIDHLLVRNVDENILRTSTGCLCCAMRGDMIGTLRDLYARREQHMVPRFRRMLIETTGLADPAPILHTLMKDPLIARRFRLDGVITTVDAVNGARQLETQPESVKQAAMADRLLITKPDLTSEESLATLQAALGQLNPNAGILRAIHGEIDPNLLLDCGLYNPRSKSPDALRWLALAEQDHGVLHARGRHAAAIQTYCLSFAQPLPWPQYADAFRSLIDRHGERLLRLKGLLAVQDEPTPIAVHGVQHLLHPPVALDRWPDDERCSRLVLITNQLPLADVLDALAALRPQRYVKTAALRH